MFTENPEEQNAFNQVKVNQSKLRFQKDEVEMSDDLSSDNNENMDKYDEEEEDDIVAEVNEDRFNQLNYLFLFDDELQLSKMEANSIIINPE